MKKTLKNSPEKMSLSERATAVEKLLSQRTPVTLEEAKKLVYALGKKTPKPETLYKGHDLRLQGDSLFIDLLLPENTYAYHMDSGESRTKTGFRDHSFGYIQNLI